MSPKAKEVHYKKPAQLLVSFTNGETRLFNLEPYLHYPIYENLRDEAYCNKARVQNGIVVWDEETNLDPDRLYFESVLLEIEK